MNLPTPSVFTLAFAGLTLLAGPYSVRAAIVYHPVLDPPIVWGDPSWGGLRRQAIDIDGDGSIDFSIETEALATGLSAPGLSAVFGVQDPPPDDIGVYVLTLDPGEEIGPALAARYGPDAGFYRDETEGGWQTLAGGFSSEYGIVVVGDFVLRRAYAGLRFKINEQTHYGWVDLENYFLSNGAAFRVHGWGYETEPDRPILAGAVPEPGVLMMLALGGGWLLIQRRRT